MGSLERNAWDCSSVVYVFSRGCTMGAVCAAVMVIRAVSLNNELFSFISQTSLSLSDVFVEITHILNHDFSHYGISMWVE